MNLKLKRLVRTNSSEQYALFDLDRLWQVEDSFSEDEQQPMTIGKLDLHYTSEGVYGTLLLWDEQSHQLSTEKRKIFAHALLDEISQPMGVPNEYVIEFFAPTLELYEVFHNVAIAAEDSD